MSDNVNHPQHYEGHTSLECFDTMIIAFGAQETYEWCLQTTYKYLWRYKFKNGMEDIKKAEWYLDKASQLEYDFDIKRSPKFEPLQDLFIKVYDKEPDNEE